MASDERLVELVRGGSEAAFEAIYDRHHRGILAFCRHMLASADEGEDALQHTFLSAYRHLVDGEAEIQLRPWLFAIARNRCLTMLRARRARPLEEYDTPATEHLSAEAQRRQDVRDLLGDVARLPEEQRAALVLAELGAVSHDEIAIVLNVPRQKVKALVFQARTSLAASRKARETPCEEIREQVANLRGGALRRTTLHRHLRECAGCRAFRDEVALQRKTLAVALPVIPTVGLKEAALGAAFGSGSAGGGAAAVSASGALAAKALVTVALVGGGATAGVEATRHAVPAPRAVESSAQAAPAVRPVGAVRHASAVPPTADRTAPAARGRHRLVGPVPAGKVRPGGPPEAAKPAPPAPASGHAKPADAKPEHPPAADAPAKAEKQPPGQAKPKKTPPGQARKADPAAQQPKPANGPKPKKAPPGQAKKAEPPAAAKAVPPGQAKKVEPPPLAAPAPKVHGKHG